MDLTDYVFGDWSAIITVRRRTGPSDRPMQRELNSLLRKLDRKAHVDWVEEMRLGKPVYDHLVACVQAKKLNKNQMANAFWVLFRLRNQGSEEEVFDLLLSHTSHREIRVRSRAVSLLIGMMQLHNLQPPFQPGTRIHDIKTALALGLEHNVASLANDFVAKHIAA